MSDRNEGRSEPISRPEIDFGIDQLEQRIVLSGDVEIVDDELYDTTEADHLPLSEVAGDDTTDAPLDPADLTLTSAAGGVIQFTAKTDTATPLEVGAGETLSGAGAVYQPLVNSGTLAPGNSPDILSVASFTQSASAILEIEIGGETAGKGEGDALDGYDRLVVSGVAELAGTLSLVLLNDFQPVAGQVYDVMKWGSRTGSFDRIDGLYAGNGVLLVPEYRADGLRLTAVKLPLIEGIVARSVDAAVTLGRWAEAVATKTAAKGLSLAAELGFDGLRLGGDLTIDVDADGRSTVAVAQGKVQWSVAGLAGGLSDVSGTLAFGGGIASTLALNGVGSVQAFGGPALAGTFGITQDTEGLLVTAAGVSASLGAQDRGGALTLSNGALRLHMFEGRMDLRASGTGAFSGVAGAGFSGTLELEAGTDLGLARFAARGATVTLPGLAAVSGDFAFDVRRETIGATVDQTMLIGVTSAAGTITVGDLMAQISKGTLALALKTRSDASGVGTITQSVAVSAVADLHLSVDGGFSLVGTQIALRYNNIGAAFTSQVQLLSGAVLYVEMAAGEQRIAGNITATIEGQGSFSGDLVLEISDAIRVLSDAARTQVAVTEYLLSGSSVSARLGGNGGLKISDSEGALIFARAKDGSGAWLASKCPTQKVMMRSNILRACV